jgi:hypothetical protein
MDVAADMSTMTAVTSITGAEAVVLAVVAVTGAAAVTAAVVTVAVAVMAAVVTAVTVGAATTVEAKNNLYLGGRLPVESSRRRGQQLGTANVIIRNLIRNHLSHKHRCCGCPVESDGVALC